jgi:hypothetical protein
VQGAENFRLITIDLEAPAEANWTDLVAEGEDVLEWAFYLYAFFFLYLYSFSFLSLYTSFSFLSFLSSFSFSLLSSSLPRWATGVAGNRLVTCYMHDVKNTMQLRDLSTGQELHQFQLDIGSVTGFSGDIRQITDGNRPNTQIHG